MRLPNAARLAFLTAFLTHPSKIGAVLPTSPWAVRDMLDMASVAEAQLVVELGPGTGVYTRQILQRLRSDARLVAIEQDPTLARMLAEQYPDPRLHVVCGSAEHADQHLGGAQADLVVSGLPLTTLPAAVRDRIVEQMRIILAPHGSNLVLQYTTRLQRQLQDTFPYVRRRLTLRNVPPALSYACSTEDQSQRAGRTLSRETS